MYDRIKFLKALLRGAENRVLIDSIIARCWTEDELYEELALPPLEFTRDEVDTITNVTIRARGPANLASIRAELEVELTENQD